MKRANVLRILGRSLIAVSAAFTFLLVAPVAFAGAPGDYNNDGVVDEADRQIIMDAQQTAVGDPDFVAAADHNGDNAISLADVAEFLKILRASN